MNILFKLSHLIIFGLLFALPTIGQAQCSIAVDVPEDITICDPMDIDLIGSVTGNYINTSWTATNGFTSDNLIDEDFVSSTTTYTFTAFAATTTNLVINGDFENGNQDFTSEYGLGETTCDPSNPWGVLGCEGVYTINTNPVNTHTNFCNGTDHTSGSGQMLIANGSSVAVNVWCQDITVIPNKDYLFTAWGMSVVGDSPASLQFSINGNLIGNDFNLSSSTCFWQNFEAEWTSGSNTNATICIRNLNTAVGGNDFAIDDIQFLEVCKEEDSFTVEIGELQANLETSHQIDCDTPIADLVITPPNPNFTYDWEALFGGTIGGPTNQANAFASTAGLYKVTVTDQINGCTRELTTTVNGSTTAPETIITGDFEISCDEDQVTVFSSNSSNNNIYNWIGSSNNSTSTSATYDETGTFLLELTNQFNCKELFFFDITEISISPEYDLNPGNILSCIGDSTTIAFSSNDPPENLTWYQPNGELITSDDTATVYDIGYYIVELEYDNGCTVIDSVEVTSQASQLDYMLDESSLITCNDSLSTLNVNINSPFEMIQWIQDSVISENQSHQVNTTGLYILEITDNNGCITRDSVNITSNTETATISTNSIDIDCANGMGSLILSSDSIVQVRWEFPDGSTQFGDSISSAIAGDYIVTATNSIGCQTIDTVTLMGNQDFPVLTIEQENLNCNNTNGAIEVSSNISDTDISWEGPNGFATDLDSFIVTESGQYIYTAITDNGCTTIDTVNIQSDFTEPNLLISSTDTITCINNQALINLSSNTTFNINEIFSQNVIDQSDSSFIVEGSGYYSVEIIGENGCTSIDSIFIEINLDEPIEFIFSPIVLDCNMTEMPIELEGITNEITQWIIGVDTLTITDDFIATEQGTFELLITDPTNGCTSSSLLTVTEDLQASTFDFDFNDINCSSTEANISLNTTQTTSNVNNIDGISQLDMFNYSTAEAGNYNFIVTYTNGCTATNSVEIKIDTIAPIISGLDRSFACMKEPLAVVVEYDIDNPSFLWEGPDNIASTEEAVITALAGSFFVTVTDEDNGCSSSLELIVSNNSTTISPNIEVIQPECFGDNGILDVINIDGGTYPYDILILDEEDNEYQTGALPAGDFTVLITDAFGCDTSSMISIDETFPFTVSAGQNQIYSGANSIQLNGTTDLADINSVEWTPSNVLSCSDCLEPFITDLDEDTWFTLSITDQNGCLDIDSILIRVVINYDFYIPNTFTPNNDGINDVFIINSNAFSANAVVDQFIIYDRWGNKVHDASNFSPNDLSNGWDGTLNNQQVKQGVYSYYFSLTLPDETIREIIGDVTIVR